MHRKKFTQSSSEIILTKTILQYCRCFLAHIGRFSTLETANNNNTFAIYFLFQDFWVKSKLKFSRKGSNTV